MKESNAQFHDLFQAFRRRIQLLLDVRRACWGITFVGVPALLLVLIDHLSAWYVTPELLAGLFVFGGVAGILYSRFMPPSDLTVALTIERRLRIKERVSTAIALEATDSDDAELRALITDDATRHLSTSSPSILFPLTFSRPLRIAPAVWAGVCLLFVLPSIPWFQSPEVREERIAMQEAGKALREEAEALRKRPETKEDEIARQVARNMKKLGIELEKNRIPKKDALVKLHKLEEQAAKAEKTLAKTQAARDRKGMQQAANAMKQAMDNRSKAEKEAARRAREQLARGKSRSELKPDELKALQREERMSALSESLARGDEQSADEAMRQLGSMLQSQELSDQERQQLAESLQQLAKSLNDTSAQEMSKAAQQAAKALKSGSPQAQKNAAKALQGMPKPGQSGNRAAKSNSMRSAQSRMASARGRMANRGMPCSKCGSSSCNGSCQGNGNKPGSGNGNKPGSGNGQKPGNGSGQNNQGSSPAPDGTGPGGGHMNDRPDARLGAGTEQVRQQPHTDGERSAYSVDIQGEPGQADQTNIPYYEVYPDYRRSAEHAIDNEQVPPGERSRVKAYFEALDPSRE